MRDLANFINRKHTDNIQRNEDQITSIRVPRTNNDAIYSCLDNQIQYIITQKSTLLLLDSDTSFKIISELNCFISCLTNDYGPV